MNKGCCIIAASILTIGVLALTAIVWLNRDLDFIIPDGPFDQSFSDGIYPNKEAEIENWFQTTLPNGTTRDQARRILSSSFSIDLTSGKRVVIERDSGWAGGHSTEVILKFKNEKIHGSEIHQTYVYL